MTSALHDVQRIVLRGTSGAKHPWRVACHLLLGFEHAAARASPLHFLRTLPQTCYPTRAGVEQAGLQVSIGFTRSGLERAGVPDHVLSRVALKAPAFWQGAALRAASRLGMTGCNGAPRWEGGFRNLDAVLSVHAVDPCDLDKAVKELAAHARRHALPCHALRAQSLEDHPTDQPGQLVHFGFRDGLSHVGIAGWTDPKRKVFRHEPGEFVLGHRQDCGAVGWIGGPGGRVWPQPIRDFFHNGSFGVFQKIQQHVDVFERFVQQTAADLDLSPELIKAKLCGRYPDGRLLERSGTADPVADFDYQDDEEGSFCPYGSHIRRMNPRLRKASFQSRGEQAAHSARLRPLLRRGMPYGPLGSHQGEERGLVGHFFCASIEDQYEHLLGEWSERVPLGSRDAGGARDPLIGSHEPGDGSFVCAEGTRKLSLTSFEPFTRTRGVAYLFYPSLATLRGIAMSDLWLLDERETR